MKAIILAGGLGTRLLPYTSFLPKPMLPLGGKPIAEHLINWAKRNKIKSFIFCVSYLRKIIENHFEDGARFGVHIEYAVSNKPLSTAGQLKTAENLVDESFVCMYGDSIYNFNLCNMIQLHTKTKAMITMSLYKYKTRLSYGVIETEGTHKVTQWNEKPEIKANINMGCYVMEPKVFDYIPKNKPYSMDNVIKNAIRRKRPVNYFMSKKGFLDIGNKESYQTANKQYLQKFGYI